MYKISIQKTPESYREHISNAESVYITGVNDSLLWNGDDFSTIIGYVKKGNIIFIFIVDNELKEEVLNNVLKASHLKKSINIKIGKQEDVVQDDDSIFGLWCKYYYKDAIFTSIDNKQCYNNQEVFNLEH
ncbi:hypothetical protein MY04_0794 [Flammeovirga sp. MY04]|uniref:hypothetical protein n=1 Tax=Flammeovirga sp. MY04 TaxID=1191459 RepID=UPI0013053CB7|nr:hypothetical protein [Flammeovirga sp. MY04]ANQ48176.2 hypothetical protein MY04_0794 [Flammeovirga sp. MY04]